MNNYIKLKCYNPFRCEYLYIDTEDHLADDLFLENGIGGSIKFKDHYIHPDHKGYVAIICRIKKRDEMTFIHCMERLNCKIIIIGHKEYINMCNFVLESLLYNAIEKENKE